MLMCVVNWITVTQVVNLWILKTCEYVTLPGKRKFTGVIKVEDLKMYRLSLIIWVSWMESQVSTKKEAEEDLTTEEERQKKTSHARKEAVIRVTKSLLKNA